MDVGQFLSQHADLFWQVLGLVGASFGVSLVTEVTKKLLALESAKVVQVLFATVSFLAAVGQYYVVDHATFPPTILGVATATFMGIATPLYIYVVKPLSSAIWGVKDVIDASPVNQNQPINKQQIPQTDQQAVQQTGKALVDEFNF